MNLRLGVLRKGQLNRLGVLSTNEAHSHSVTVKGLGPQKQCRGLHHRPSFTQLMITFGSFGMTMRRP